MGKTYEGSYEDIEAITNALEFYPKAMANIKDEVIPDTENTHKHVMVHQAAGVALPIWLGTFPCSTLDLKSALHWPPAVVDHQTFRNLTRISLFTWRNFT